MTGNGIFDRAVPRRAVIASSLPLVAAATMRPAAATTSDRPAFGAPARSESVVMSALDPDARSGFEVRLCRYPDEGLTWVWAQVFHASRVYSFTDTTWPCTRAMTPVDEAGAQYAASQAEGRIVFDRAGSRPAPRGVKLALSLGLHQNPFAPDGPGRTPVELIAEFMPVSASEGILDGRSEIKGTIGAKLRIGNRSLALACLGHYHEQVQEKPRFVDPFVYFRGWGRGIYFTMLRGAAASSSGGVLFQDGKPIRAVAFDVAPPSASRRFRIKREDGSSMQGHADATYVFGQRIYGAWRPSRIVRGEVDGIRFAGMLNDWRPEKLPYI